MGVGALVWRPADNLRGAVLSLQSLCPGIEGRSLGLAASAFTHGAIFLALVRYFKQETMLIGKSCQVSRELAALHKDLSFPKEISVIRV